MSTKIKINRPQQADLQDLLLDYGNTMYMIGYANAARTTPNRLTELRHKAAISKREDAIADLFTEEVKKGRK